jgi:hypothetical protein
MPLTIDQAAEQVRRYSEFHASERASTALAKTERDLATAKRQKRASRVAAPKFTRSIAPQAFNLTLSPSDAAIEPLVRTDGAFQLAVEKYADARRNWWAAVSRGGRGAIDRAGWELTVRYAAAIQTVCTVGIRAIKDASDEKDREIRLLQARLDQLTEEKDRAFEEARESRQIPAPIKVELTLPTALPDLNVNLKPSTGVELDYDAHGRVVGTRPRGTDPVTKALKQTQAGAGILP